MAGGFMEKVKDFVKGNPEQADSAIEKVEDLVDQLAGTFTVYPSLSGSVAEAARQLHAPQ